jgi:AraC-like DNA-binding protein
VGTEQVVHLRRARDLMDARYAEPLSLDDMAAVAGFSRYHFAREFRVVFGETPRAYLSRRRVERAKDLLVHANLTVTEVCMVVGFSSLGSFSRRFRELVGCSPTEFRSKSTPAAIPGCIVMAWARPKGSNRGQASGQP